MGVRLGRFVPSNKPAGRSPGYGDFKEFAVSGQIRKPLTRASYDIVAIAKLMVPPSGDARDGHYADKFAVHSGAMTVRVGRNVRAVVQISNHAKNAVAVEFGSGPPSEGKAGGAPREQGGWNRAKRPLGRAGRKIGRAG